MNPFLVATYRFLRWREHRRWADKVIGITFLALLSTPAMILWGAVGAIAFLAVLSAFLYFEMITTVWDQNQRDRRSSFSPDRDQA